MPLVRSPFHRRDNGLQQAHRPSPSRTADPLRSQVRVDQNPAITVTSIGGGAQSQYRPVPQQESPQRVPPERLASGATKTEIGAQRQGAEPGAERSSQQQEQGAGHSIVGSQQEGITYAQSAPRKKSVGRPSHCG